MIQWQTFSALAGVLVCVVPLAGCSDSGKNLAAVASGATAVTSGVVPGATAAGASGPLTPVTAAVYSAPPQGKLGVVASSPPDYGRDVPIGVTITLTFSEAVDVAAVASATTVDRGDGALLGSWTRSAPRVHEFSPAVPLESSTTYLVRVAESLNAASGSPMSRPFRMAFSTPERPRFPLRAGAAAVDITPPVGVPLGGYGSELRRLRPGLLFWFQSGADTDPTNFNVVFKQSVAKRDPIRAKALVLSDGVRKVAIVSVDVIGASTQMFNDIAPRILARTGIRPADLFVHGTHTHHGPGAISQDRIYWHIAMDYFDSRVYDPLLDGIVQAVVDAAAALRPAELGATTVTEDRIGANRRTHPGRYGKHLSIIKVSEPGGRPIATLFNLPFHPAALKIDDLRLSADVAGEAERRIEGAIGGVALFVNECEGDVKADTPGGNSEAHVVRLGHTLGDRVLSELGAIATTPDVPLNTVAMVYDMGAPQFRLGCGPGTQVSFPASICGFMNTYLGLHPQLQLPIAGLHSQVFRFCALRLGDQALIATVPGEPITNVGVRIRDGLLRSGVRRPVTFGLTNGHMAYITDATEYDEGGYESESTLFGRDTGERVIENALFVSTHLVR